MDRNVNPVTQHMYFSFLNEQYNIPPDKNVPKKIRKAKVSYI